MPRSARCIDRLIVKARILQHTRFMLSFPAVNFHHGETIDLLRGSVQKFAAKEIAPRAGEIDRLNQFAGALWRKMRSLGFLGITTEEQFGGTNMGYLAHVLAMEEIS